MSPPNTIYLHHIHLQAPRAKLLEIKAFYMQLLDLQEGPRPAFPREGYWLYSGTHPMIHLAVLQGEDAVQAEQAMAEGKGYSSIGHIAFGCEDMPAMLEKLLQMNVVWQIKDVPPLAGDDPASKQQQVFLTDPTGNKLELNFIVPR